jgi:hypothetical protein
VLSDNDVVENSLGDPNTAPLEGPGVGAGISLIGSHALLLSNRIEDNEALNGSSTGGGVYLEWSVADLWHNVIATNHAPEGSGVYAIASQPMLFNNWISENENWYWPPLYFGSATGAVSIHQCWDLDILFNYFVANVATSGAAVYLDQPYRGRVANNLFVGNQAFDRQLSSGGEGGGIWFLVRQDPPEPFEIVGNTFSDNTATGSWTGEMGGAIAVLPLSSGATIANNLMAFNSSGIYQRSGFTTHPVLVHNGMYNGTADYVGLPAGATDVVADPLFVERASGNYRLQPDSPMIEQGDADGIATSTDLDGAPRLQDADYDGLAVVDIGAYEYSPDFDLDATPDWLDEDDDDDGALDTEDCAALDPAAWSTPLEVDGVQVGGGVASVVSWSVHGTDLVYDVVAGSLSELRADRGLARAACEVDDSPEALWTDDQPQPAAGEGRYYLVREANSCGEGGWGAGRAVAACP